ncbi:integrase [Klebsiella pneumoniae]|nr:integrase [Klebsiella pneumoniae]
MIKSLAPEGMLAAVFEDDGRTGYFYALDESVEGNPIAPVVERLNGIEAHLDQERAVHGVRLENGIYGHSRFCNTDFDDKLACLNLSGV